MSTDNSEPRPPSPPRYTRLAAPRPPARGPNRLAFRLIGIPVLAVAGVLIYRGVHDYFVLPECDSARAKSTLTNVLKQLNVEPLRYEPLNTVSATKNEVVCNALLPLSDGGSVNVDYRFFWQGTSAEMRYSVSRKPAQKSSSLQYQVR
jgi:hypothetical protein